MRKEGASLKTIAKSLGASKSSVSLWVRNLELSDRVQKVISDSYTNGQKAARETIPTRTSQRLSEARNEAEALILKEPISDTTALILCSLLYWCEGAKTPNDNGLKFSNSDSLLVASYLSLFRRSTAIDEKKFRALLHLHEYHEESVQLKFWSEVTKIPVQQFNRTYWKPHTGKRVRPDYPGCIHIGYHDVRISRKVYATARAFLERETNIPDGPIV